MLEPKLTDGRHIAREILSYLGSLPRQLHEQRGEAAAQTAISVGNLLLWIHSNLEDVPPLEQPLNETAQTVYALGKQFRAVGQNLWGKSACKSIEERVEILERLATAGNVLHNLTITIPQKKGGAK